MSILKQILSPFVEFKEKEPSTKEATAAVSPTNNDVQEKQPPLNERAKSPEIFVSPTPGNTSGTVPAQYQKHFDELIDEANTKNPLFQGTDFKEFIDSKIDVEAISDEATRYRTAFNVLKRTGLTKEKLLITGQQYVTIIENDLKAFDNAYNQHYKTDVEGKEQLLQKKAEELQVLNEKISALNEEMKQLSQQITQSKNNLTSNRASFVSAGEAKMRELQSELQKIDHYFS